MIFPCFPTCNTLFNYIIYLKILHMSNLILCPAMNKDRAVLISTLSVLFILSVTNVPMELHSAVNYFTHMYKRLTFCCLSLIYFKFTYFFYCFIM
jgi:hypothetical protein